MNLLILMCVALAAAGLLLTLAEQSHAQPPDQPAKPNHLIHETSPYLLQHAHNPVDWYPWGKAAFDKARAEHKPIFLSIGYSTCHWCHVMAHESFEDPAVAKILNDHFVSIKVDREERPDVDEQYMLATQLFTQRGGWPNSVWLTPDGRPWYAGTYFPREDRGGRPGFKTLLLELARTWREHPEQVEEQANRFAQAIRAYGSGAHLHEPHARLSPQLIDRALAQFRSTYDARNGGFGTAPKFPPHGALALFLQQQKITGSLDDLAILTGTLDAMAAGGDYDQIGGGFHRYSTDARWFLPHFEKMLYDNAQLIRSYAQAADLTGDENYRRVVARTFDWLTREMTDPQGGFYAAIDADSEGVEGKFYLWTYDEALATLGKADGELFAKIYGITPEGNYREEATGHATGENVLYLPRPLADVATEVHTDGAALEAKLEPMRRKLLEARSKRVRPHLDDKVLSGWNGLMIAGLARAGALLKEPRYTAAAAKAADFVLHHMRTPGGGLLRSWRKGEAKIPAYLDDYAFVIDGLLELHAATHEERRLTEARELADRMIADFNDPQDGGFYFTSAKHDALLLRAKELGGGGNIPSGNGVAADDLLRLAALTGEKKYADAAAGTLRHFASSMANQPHGSEAMLLALAHADEWKAKLPTLELDTPVEFPGPKPDASSTQGPAAVAVYLDHDAVTRGQTLTAMVRIRIEPGYHVYAPTVDPTQLIPSRVTVESKAFTAGDAHWPKPGSITDPVLGRAIATYEGTVDVKIPLTIAADVPEGKIGLVLSVWLQACDEKLCLPPQRYRLSVPVTVGPTAGPPRHPKLFNPPERR